MWEPLIITGLLAFISTLIGLALYKRSESHVEYKWARFSGAAAIAVAAYIGMTSFYLKLTDRVTLQNETMVQEYLDARNEYNVCLEHERVFACRDPATKLRDACSALVDLEGIK